MNHAQPVSGRSEAAQAPTAALGLRQSLLALFKVRIVLLLLFASAGGAILAASGWPGGGQLALLLVTGGLAASGASALNEFLERNADARMQRTRSHRPLVLGSFRHPGWVPWLGLSMILLPSLAVFPVRPALKVFLLLGAFVYVPVYTIWLKQRTPLNIVVGGLAGSAAVLSGSAAVGAWQDAGALLLALLVSLWTPTHFWSLAIVHRDDYARGGFPMLPVSLGPGRCPLGVAPHRGHSPDRRGPGRASRPGRGLPGAREPGDRLPGGAQSQAVGPADGKAGLSPVPYHQPLPGPGHACHLRGCSAVPVILCLGE